MGVRIHFSANPILFVGGHSLYFVVSVRIKDKSSISIDINVIMKIISGCRNISFITFLVLEEKIVIPKTL